MRMIAAVDEGWGIGYQGELLCRLSADLRRFKELTWGHPVILGRKTLATFPGGRPLPGRRNLVLSRDPGFTVEGAEVYHNRSELLAVAPADSFVIGGESVYRELLDACDTVYITKIRAAFPADAFFPDLDALPEWEAAEADPPRSENGLRFQYVTYRRK